MVKKKCNNAVNIVSSTVMLPSVEVVWLPLETFQTLFESQIQETDCSEEVEGGDSPFLPV